MLVFLLMHILYSVFRATVKQVFFYSLAHKFILLTTFCGEKVGISCYFCHPFAM